MFIFHISMDNYDLAPIFIIQNFGLRGNDPPSLSFEKLWRASPVFGLVIAGREEIMKYEL